MQTILNFMSSLSERIGRALRSLLRMPSLPAGDLLHDRNYRRIFASVIITHFGAQITMLALPLTAATVLNATPTQMGFLMAAEIVPFVLLSLPAGVWLDRVRKLPVYVIGETALAFVVASVPLAWWMGWLAMPWLYVVGLVIGTIYTTAGSAAQIVLTQVVARERLVEAHAKNALATSGAEVAGPGFAGALIKLVGAPLALLVDAVLLLVSAGILRGIVVNEERLVRHDAHFWRDLKTGVRFVARQRGVARGHAVVAGAFDAVVTVDPHLHRIATLDEVLPGRRLPPVLPIVLYNGASAWRAASASPRCASVCARAAASDSSWAAASASTWTQAL